MKKEVTRPLRLKIQRNKAGDRFVKINNKLLKIISNLTDKEVLLQLFRHVRARRSRPRRKAPVYTSTRLLNELSSRNANLEKELKGTLFQIENSANSVSTRELLEAQKAVKQLEANSQAMKKLAPPEAAPEAEKTYQFTQSQLVDISKQIQGMLKQKDIENEKIAAKADEEKAAHDEEKQLLEAETKKQQEKAKKLNIDINKHALTQNKSGNKQKLVTALKSANIPINYFRKGPNSRSGEKLINEMLKEISDRIPEASQVESGEMSLNHFIDEVIPRYKPADDPHGTGQKEGHDGLYGSEILEIMEPYREHGFKGVFAADQVHEIPVSKEDKIVSFIMNLDKQKKPGSHWVSVYIDPEESLEYYDSLGKEPTPLFQGEITRVIQNLQPEVYLKFKVNKVKHQHSLSKNCGWHAMRFLMDRYSGKPFKECSGYTDLKEDEAKKMKKKFGFI